MRRSLRVSSNPMLSSPLSPEPTVFRKRPRVIPSTPEEELENRRDDFLSSATAVNVAMDDESLWSQCAGDNGSLFGSSSAAEKQNRTVEKGSTLEADEAYSDDDSQCSEGNFSTDPDEESVLEDSSKEEDTSEEEEEEERDSDKEFIADSDADEEDLPSTRSGSEKSKKSPESKKRDCPVARLLRKANKIDKKIFHHQSAAEKLLAEAYAVDYKIRLLTNGTVKSPSTFIPGNLVRNSAENHSSCSTQ